jgi:hypothetical protein
VRRLFRSEFSNNLVVHARTFYVRGCRDFKFFVLNGHLNAIVIRKLAASIMSLAVRAAYHAHSIILRGSYCGGCSLKCAINWPLSVLKSVDVLHGHILCFPIVDGRDGRRSAASGCLGRAFTSCSLAISSSICVALAC